MVCGRPGRYVRGPRQGDPGIWCDDHAPRALPPWLLLLTLLVGLALLGAGCYGLGLFRAG